MRVVAALALLAIGGCGGNSGHSGGDLAVLPDMSLIPNCPDDLPAACPSPEPSWDGGVQAIIDTRCAICHKPGGLAADKAFSNYADVYGYRGEALDQVYSCYMPPPDGGTLAPSERKALLGWFVCGAPNN